MKINGPKERFQAWMPSAILRRVEWLATARRIDARDVVIDALNSYLPEAEKRTNAELRKSGQLGPSVLRPSA